MGTKYYCDICKVESNKSSDFRGATIPVHNDYEREPIASLDIEVCRECVKKLNNHLRIVKGKLTS